MEPSEQILGAKVLYERPTYHEIPLKYAVSSALFVSKIVDFTLKRSNRQFGRMLLHSGTTRV